ncbi:signal recognition particle subunit Srp72 [Schizosaccharomyces pombe]|uniref:Signal recognition particle subunit srp72 n=1 Tax=Schizosaccharomyces pombe (strain 972 / ATCC 24843) TaxID=284812 RepID=SRP72_SCHPO|nr:putative signal recognition particle subunit Srp72 [Schizosaccharomyces pombe]O59787.1 RecName: Full=Signal recognition particle subunit srp72; AltName: Full=Signal recognition particle 72 kDa protein homolog [Schizosaccharomyces pombe 972h-]CAA18312.1 signal recognition particle subunit Srp72 (predicted) [Schizosaccharomyces pombe]|eukprot:NP_587719.1 putative signal recognition particle subunit Srp72 [Schizosaccharomyces pombe]
MSNHEEEIEELAQRIGKIEVGDTKSDIYQKVLNLIDIERYEHALKIIEKYLGETDAVYERAYCAFQLGKEDFSLEDKQFLQHLQAQKAYRLSDFSKALKIYEHLENDLPEQRADIRVNMLAAASQLPGLQLNNAVSLDDQDSVFNLATRYLTIGDWNQAIELLSSSLEKLENSDSNSEDHKSQINLCRLQLFFAYLQAGDNEKASKESLKISKDCLDETSQAIFVNNLISMSIDNPYISFRDLHGTNLEKALSSLLASQKKQFIRNLALLDMAVGKQRSVRKEKKRNPEESIYFSTILLREETKSLISPKKLPGYLENLFKSDSDNIVVALLLMQHKISNGNFRGALSIYQKLRTSLEASQSLSVLYSPGLVGLGDALHYKIQSTGFKSQLLHEAANYWRKQQSCEAKLLLCTRSLLAHLDERAPVSTIQDDMSVIDDLLQWKGPISELVSCKVAALCYLDKEIESGMDKYLVPTKDLITGIDVDDIEIRGVPVSAAIGPIKRSVEANSSNSSKKTRKRRKPTPKSFNPKATPDPQRWIPKRDRTNVKIKSKGKSMQGGVA